METSLNLLGGKMVLLHKKSLSKKIPAAVLRKRGKNSLGGLEIELLNLSKESFPPLLGQPSVKMPHQKVGF